MVAAVTFVVTVVVVVAVSTIAAGITAIKVAAPGATVVALRWLW